VAPFDRAAMVRSNSDFNMVPRPKVNETSLPFAGLEKEKTPATAEALFCLRFQLLDYARDKGLRGLYPKKP
jgi:hypothetical protein